jgi:hypothetical protein
VLSASSTTAAPIPFKIRSMLRQPAEFGTMGGGGGGGGLGGFRGGGGSQCRRTPPGRTPADLCCVLPCSHQNGGLRPSGRRGPGVPPDRGLMSRTEPRETRVWAGTTDTITLTWYRNGLQPMPGGRVRSRTSTSTASAPGSSSMAQSLHPALPDRVFVTNSTRCARRPWAAEGGDRLLRRDWIPTRGTGDQGGPALVGRRPHHASPESDAAILSSRTTPDGYRTCPVGRTTADASMATRPPPGIRDRSPAWPQQPPVQLARTNLLLDYDSTYVHYRFTYRTGKLRQPPSSTTMWR